MNRVFDVAGLDDRPDPSRAEKQEVVILGGLCFTKVDGVAVGLGGIDPAVNRHLVAGNVER